MTLQGWLAQWSMTTLLEHRTTLAYLAYLGYPLFARTLRDGACSPRAAAGHAPSASSAPSSYAWLDGTAVATHAAYDERPSMSTSALKLVRRPRVGDRRRAASEQCGVFLALVLGAPGSGKSALLNKLVGKPFASKYAPTHRLHRAVGAVELNGAERYLVLQEYGSRNEAEALRSAAKLTHVNAIVFVYDSSDMNSFSYVSNLRQQHPYLQRDPTPAALLPPVDR